MSTPTAQWPAPALLVSLGHCEVPELQGRAGHGPLAVLTALAKCLPHDSAAGQVTAAQVARVAGYSERWTRRCLQLLERLGLVTWSRGWRGHAGRMRIVKAAVAAMIRRYRAARSRNTAGRRGRHELPEVSSAHSLQEVTAAHGGQAVDRPAHESTLSKRNLMAKIIKFPRHYTPPPDRRVETSPPPRSSGELCEVCWRPEEVCRRQNSKVPAELRHPFTPRGQQKLV